MEHQEMDPLGERSVIRGNGGLLIASKIPFSRLGALHFSNAYGMETWVVHKGALGVRLKLPNGKMLDVVTTHLQSPIEDHPCRRWFGCCRPKPYLCEAVQRSQIVQVVRAFAEHRTQEDPPLIVLGDFNVNVVSAEDEGRCSYGFLKAVMGHQPSLTEKFVTFPTMDRLMVPAHQRGRPQCLDHIFSTLPDLCIQEVWCSTPSEVTEDGVICVSDHACVGVCIEL